MKKILIIIFLSLGVFANAQMTRLEQEVLDEINLCRTKPQDYVQYIDNFLDLWDSDVEERETAEELKGILRNMEPLQALKFSNDLYESTKKHANYLKRTKKFEHSDCPYGENIQYGNEYARYAVIDLLIDNGVPDRGHRKNLLKPSYSYCAVSYIERVNDDILHLFVQQFK